MPPLTAFYFMLDSSHYLALVYLFPFPHMAEGMAHKSFVPYNIQECQQCLTLYNINKYSSEKQIDLKYHKSKYKT